MRFCEKCGSRIPDNAKFCNECGNSSIDVIKQSDMVPLGVKKLHCPNCRSYNFSSLTESSVSGAFTTGGGNFAVTSVSNEHKTFWLCHDCGMKFRNIYDFEEELKKDLKKLKLCRTLIPVFFVLSVAFFILGFIFKSKQNPDEFIDMMVYYMTYSFAGAATFLIVFIVFLIFYLSGNSVVKKESEELDVLKAKCYN